jgi:hypothetical protein
MGLTRAELLTEVDAIFTKEDYDTQRNKKVWVDRINNAKEDELGTIETALSYYPPSEGGGRRRNKSNNIEMKMVDVKRLCKNNQIKLSKTVNGKRIVYTKKELITKLKRKKLL